MRGLGTWGRTLLLMAVLMVGSVTAQQKGTFTDSRDGQKYKTVKIGTQTWMAENMNVKTGTSWCYDDDESNCKKYGRLYAWQTAVKMVCPSGWRLPSRNDWDDLGRAAGGERKPDDKGNIDWYGAGKKLKAKSGWNNRKDGSGGNGTDDFGFSALPGGSRGFDGDFYDAGGFGNWWTATEDYYVNAYNRGMGYDYDNVVEDNLEKSYGFSVRCVADT